MPKIAIIGAGGYVFPLRLIGDFLTRPSLRASTLSLMDIDLARAERTARAAREVVEHYGYPTVLETTTDQRAALAGADYVIVTFQVGGLEAYRHDVEIPRKYGVDQTVGDTLGPGGVFRFLRSSAAFRKIASDMAELCPNALLINYANPMAMNCWYLYRLGVKTVGLCHSVQGTSRMLADMVGVPYDEVSFLSAGINHQAWFLKFERNGCDLYPQLRETLFRHNMPGPDGTVPAPSVKGLHTSNHGDIYQGNGFERTRTNIMAAFGYFHTESSHHGSEYVPYFRKNARMVKQFVPYRWDYYEICSAHDEEEQTRKVVAQFKQALVPSVEYGSLILDSIETGQPRVVYGNVENRGAIANLPADCCVEVPCLVDRQGVRATVVGSLPPQLAAINQNAVNVQRLAVEAALTGDREHIYHAVMLDPLTSAVLTLGQIRAMVDEMLSAEAQWLPDFQG